MSTIVTRSGKGSPLTNNEIDSNFSNLNTDKAELSGAAFTGAITTNSTFDGRDVATDGTKLDGIEPGATADQTAAQIKTAYESNSNTNAFTDADESKLNGIEASADVTDAANVTAAGALMDGEVTNLAEVKAFASSDYATAAQGATANAALPKSGGTMTGALVLNNTGSVKVSAGTTAQRESSPSAGMFRYNSTQGKFEGYATEWGEIGGGGAFNDFVIKTANYTAVTKDQIITNKAAAAPTSYAVTVSAGVFQIDGSANPVLTLTRGVTYTFIQSDNSNSNHPIAFKDASGNSYTSGVTSTGTPGNSGAQTVFVVPSNAPSSLRYYCTVHGNYMGNTINIVDDGLTITLPTSPVVGNLVFIKNAGTSTVTVARNGSKINSTADNGELATDAGATLVYVDSAIGWKEI